MCPFSTNIHFDYDGHYSKAGDDYEWIPTDARLYVISFMTSSLEEITYSLLKERICRKKGIYPLTKRLNLGYIPLVRTLKLEAYTMGRIMEWAARSDHLGGIPRKAVITAVGAFARAVANLCNKTTVHNADTLLTLVRSRPPGVPLITVSNHMSTLDDPVMWGGFKGLLLSLDPELARWVLAAEDICFKNPVFSYIFRTGKLSLKSWKKLL
uniref:Tafazzin family protein n=1 Tax=Brassica oleracea var. oleracea TaxID=109376 RepID=A0A0D3AUW4_BRAOL